MHFAFSARFNRNDRLPGRVERRTQQIIHRRVHHREMLFRARFQQFHPGHQNPGIADNCPARFNQNFIGQTVQALHEGRRVISGQRRFLIAVANAQPAAQIEMTQVNAQGFQPRRQRQHPIQGVHERRNLGELRTDMAIDAHDMQMR